MTTTNATRQEILDSIQDAIGEIMYADLRNGANDYAFVRVWPDGSVTSGREPSRCVPESEYFKQAPHPVTVWSASGFREPAGREDGVFEWEECSPHNGSFYANGKHWEMTDTLVDPIDLEEVMSKIDDELDSYDWLPA